MGYPQTQMELFYIFQTTQSNNKYQLGFAIWKGISFRTLGLRFHTNGRTFKKLFGTGIQNNTLTVGN